MSDRLRRSFAESPTTENIKFVVAASCREATDLAEDFGHDSEEEAFAHLEECVAPPTDPFYGNKLHVYKVELNGEKTET